MISTQTKSSRSTSLVYDFDPATIASHQSVPPATLIASLHENAIPAEERRKSITTVLKEVREDDQTEHQVELHNCHGNKVQNGDHHDNNHIGNADHLKNGHSNKDVHGNKVQDGDHHANNHIGNADHLTNGHSNKDVHHKKEHVNVAFEPDSKLEVKMDDTRL